ncbi:hypothetical protein [Nostoc sp.]|uniref:hypothetical protein n=1 Tax=Nostoc sp. TaxID=1180 RepID=UPI002FF7D3CC
MATIKISELPESQFEMLSDADLRLVNGGASSYQFTLTGGAIAAGVSSGQGSVYNATDSVGSYQGGTDSLPFFGGTYGASALSGSFPF